MDCRQPDRILIRQLMSEQDEIQISIKKIHFLNTGMNLFLFQERLSVLAAPRMVRSTFLFAPAPRMVRSTFLFARLRSAGGVYLSGGLKPATETIRILIYPPLIEAGVFPTEIKPYVECTIYSSFTNQSVQNQVESNVSNIIHTAFISSAFKFLNLSVFTKSFTLTALPVKYI